MAKITVGLPIFNAGKYLNDAIQSVINQTYTNWLLIIIDDGSTDDSLSIARGFTDDRIK
ncbi:glycosyltransferase family A protein [Deinococcus sp. JMULE3]|uniref:glycosyltransferase family 2 protein n=1 Tax=Deinococcus sp. JMULE3 TaxID=2518341 RepID=UPI001575E48D|nr:glycosyltransferase family 2 protein [Deinococcus sp. JMULE3]